MPVGDLVLIGTNNSALADKMLPRELIWTWNKSHYSCFCFNLINPILVRTSWDLPNKICMAATHVLCFMDRSPRPIIFWSHGDYFQSNSSSAGDWFKREIVLDICMWQAFKSSAHDVGLGASVMDYSKSGYYKPHNSSQVQEFLGWPYFWFQDIHTSAIYKHPIWFETATRYELNSGFKNTHWTPTKGSVSSSMASFASWSTISLHSKPQWHSRTGYVGV